MADAQSRFTIRADNAQYDAAMAKSDKATRNLDKSQKDLGNNAGQSASGFDRLGAAVSSGRQKLDGFAKIAAGAGAALTVALVKNGLQSADALAKTADQVGITTQSLAGLHHAAELSGAGTSAMDKALEKLSIRMSEAAAGTGVAVDTFEALGLSAENVVKYAPDEAMYKVADALNSVENSAQKTKIAYDIFGRSGVSLINTFAEGSEGLRSYQREAEAAGIALDRIDARKIEMANDSMFRIQQSMTGFSQHLAAKFAPLLEGIADRLFGIGKESGGMASAAGKAFDFMVKAAGVFADGIHALNIGWNAMKLAFQTAAKFIVGGLDSLARAAVDMYNALPWVDDVEYTRMFEGFLVTMDSEIEESKRKIDELLSRELPSDAIEQYVDDTERAFEAQAIAIQESQEGVQGAIITTDQVTAALSRTSEKTAQKSKESAKEVKTAWDEALEGMAERIDTEFSNAWKDALDGNLDSFKDFGNALLDGAKQMAAELLHLNITRPLVQGVAGAFGLGGATAAAAGTGAGGTAGTAASGLSGLSSLSTVGSVFSLNGLVGGATNLIGMLPAGSALQTGAAGYLGGLGQTGFNALSSVGITGASAGTNVLAGGVINAGAGLAGGFAGNAVFGESEHGNTLATVGGVVGSIWGPLGSAVGSFIGSGLGSLIGGENREDRTALNVDFATGNITRGRSRGHAMDEAANAVTAELLAFAQSIGGSTANFSVRAHGEHGFGFDGEGGGRKQFDDVNAFMDAAFDRIIDGATHLDEALRDLLVSFEGTAEQTQLYTAAMISIDQVLDNNPFEAAVADFEAANRTLSITYEDQFDHIRTLVANFDGSAEAAAELNQALISNQQSAYEFALAVQQIGKSIDEAAAAQAKSIRESLLSEEQIYASRQAERDALRASLDGLTDAGELNSVVQRILQLNQELFDDIDEENRTEAVVDRFASYAEQTSADAQAVLEDILAAGEAEQRDLYNDVSSMMQAAADRQAVAAEASRQAAEDLVVAAEDLTRAAAQLQQSGLSGGELRAAQLRGEEIA